MKTAFLSLLTIVSVTISLAGVNAHAMSKNIAKIIDKSISDTEIVANFNLRASDGSVVSFQPNSVQSVLKLLPAESNADYRLCDKLDTKLFLSLTQIGLDQLEHPRPLNSAEIALIKKTPRCEQYLSSLNLIAASLANQRPSTAPPREELESFSVKLEKKVAYIVLKTESGKTAPFKVSGSLDGIKNVRDFNKLQVLASQSGQNIGLRFSLTDVDYQDPDRDRDFERCTYTRYERQCRTDRDGREKCEQVSVTEEGIRRVISTSQKTYYSLKLELVDIANRVVATGLVSDLDWDIDTDKGTCEPRDFGRDDRHGGHRR